MKMSKLLLPAFLSSTILAAGGCAAQPLDVASASTGTETDQAEAATNAEQEMAFRNADLPIETRVDDLVSRMTLEEKTAQMLDKAPAIPRLGVPEYVWWNEALHGVARAGKATVFPQAIGLAATWDEDLMLRTATVISDEGRAKHHDFLKRDVRSIYTGLTFWSPNINIFRDPRWGRGQETYGEDPFLTGRMAVNFVRGLQGDDPKYLKTIATVKHFAVHSGPEKSRHSDDYVVSKHDLNETYMPAFRMAIREANPRSVMCAYNAVFGNPACASPFLLQTKLREEFGFNGYIVSDCGAINDVYLPAPKHHGFTKTRPEGVAVSVKAGTDLECEDGGGKSFLSLNAAVKEGLLSEADIDRSVKRLFTERFRLGMFDDESRVKYASIPIDVVGSPKHLALAKEAALKSIVLLKNDGVLPLKPGAKIAIIGPNADNFDILIGNYHGKPVNPVTPLAALRASLDNAKISYAPGSALAGNVFTHYQPVPASAFSHMDSGSAVSGLKAQYFAAATSDGQPARRQIDANIDFKWTKNPATGLDDGSASAIWEGLITPEKSGRYRFAPGMSVTIDGNAVGDDGVRLKAGMAVPITVRWSAETAWHSNAIEPMASLGWIDLDRDLAGEALKAAKASDVVLFFSGLSAKLEGEEMQVDIPGFDGGDRNSLNLPKEQMDLLKQLQATGKPVVLVNLTGSAVNLAWAKEKLPAIVQGFYPGESAGPAIADVLTGAYSPAGRLPVTFYENLEGMPPLDDYSMQNRTYKYYTGKPVYSFGHGLSYTRFAYSAFDMPASHNPELPMTVSVTVANTGKIASDEVVQLYATRSGSGVKPIRELVGFQRINLAPGAKQVVSMQLPVDRLTYIDSEGVRRPYNGAVEFSIGSGQPSGATGEAIAKKTVTFTN